MDPLSTWWGLKAAGRGPGFAIPVIGGLHGDVALNLEHLADQARALAAHCVATKSSVVIDLGDLRKGALVRFAEVFLAELYATSRTPLWLVLEEADVLAPQQPMPDTTRVLGEVDRIARRGRQFGFRLITITQRPAKIAKDVLTQLSTLIALGLTSPQDRKAVEDWVAGVVDKKEAVAFAGSLAGLEVGEGFVWTPDKMSLERVRFPEIRTLDTSATPKAGAPAPKARPVKVDVDSLREAMAIQEKPVAPVSSQPDPENGAIWQPKPADAAALAAAEQRGYERGQAEGLRKGAAAGWKAAAAILEREITACASLFPATPDHADAEQEIVAALGVPARPKAMNKAGSAAARTTKPTAKYDENYAGNYSASPGDAIASAVSAPNSGAPVSMPGLGAERRILAVLAGAHPAGMTEAQWAVAAGMKRTGGTWSTYKQRLRRAGAVEARDGQWFSTATGLKSVGSSVERIPPPGPELVEFWIARISGVGPMLRALAGRYPLTFSRMKLAEHLHMAASGGTFGAYLGRLNSAGLIEKIAFNEVRAAPALMESSK